MEQVVDMRRESLSSMEEAAAASAGLKEIDSRKSNLTIRTISILFSASASLDTGRTERRPQPSPSLHLRRRRPPR